VMSLSITTTLLWTAALGSGLMAGIYFAFSGFIMRALDNTGARDAIIVMNSINQTILRSGFMPLFFGTTLVSVLMVFVSIVFWSGAQSVVGMVAGSVYFFGMFACTALFNVPLNTALAKWNPDNEGATDVWSNYLVKWVRWNHLRTVCSITTSALSIWLLTTL